MFQNLKQAYLPKTEFPVRKIDREKCTQCRRCYETCPTDGYIWGEDNYPQPVGYGGFKEACLNCWNCTAVCSSGAISIEGSYAVLDGRYRSLLNKEMKYPDPLGRDSDDFEKIEPRLTEVERVIYRRRSNRLFRDKEVPEALLRRILEAGRFAPSAGNCQPYKFIVITNRDLIHELEQGAMKLLRMAKNLYLDKKGKRRLWKNIVFSFYSWFRVNETDPRPFTAMKKADRTGDTLYWNAPVVIVICKDVRGVSNPDLDAGLCAQNMVLTAHSLGLGTCYIGLTMVPLSMPIMAKFRKKIGITYPWKAVTTIAIGYSKGKIDGIVKRDTPQVKWLR